ncbi:hypothetical protein [Carboxylicivirga linearis]|uniref:Uncharacterized protein n=1 Tax=Carboxylicivirga linearis TaxID=1628157 RepID=A0ABS5K0C6_9BACT|nr:hypothetical protein [Carboxylicivirga linearis]MBS2100535.1 hypothetical protein [Carboxylicivirga linearis]
MKSYKVILSNDKIEFFKELMDRLGINYEDEIQAIQKMNALKEEAERVKKTMAPKEGNKGVPMDDSSIQDVLKRIEEMRKK